MLPNNQRVMMTQLFADVMTAASTVVKNIHDPSLMKTLEKIRPYTLFQRRRSNKYLSVTSRTSTASVVVRTGFTCPLKRVNKICSFSIFPKIDSGKCSEIRSMNPSSTRMLTSG